MSHRHDGRLKRLEIAETVKDERAGPVIQILVRTHEEAQKSRELDELFRTGRAYLDTEKLPPKEVRDSFSFDDLLAAVVHLPEEEAVLERAGAPEHRKRMFV